jgi:hypothetical protein
MEDARLRLKQTFTNQALAQTLELQFNRIMHPHP